MGVSCAAEEWSDVPLTADEDEPKVHPFVISVQISHMRTLAGNHASKHHHRIVTQSAIDVDHDSTT